MKQITALLLSFVSFSSLAFNLSVNNGSSCTLFEESTIFETKLTSPCNWAVNAQGDLQTLSVKGNKVAILLGQPLRVEWRRPGLSHSQQLATLAEHARLKLTALV